jgi:hypothetical protein
VFDHEPGLLPAKETSKREGVELSLKTAGQKVGLMEVTIRFIREKARSTKAGVRAKYGYLPANQFNVNLRLDSIAVMNRIPKINNEKLLINCLPI